MAVLGDRRKQKKLERAHPRSPLAAKAQQKEKEKEERLSSCWIHAFTFALPEPIAKRYASQTSATSALAPYSARLLSINGRHFCCPRSPPLPANVSIIHPLSAHNKDIVSGSFSLPTFAIAIYTHSSLPSARKIRVKTRNGPACSRGRYCSPSYLFRARLFAAIRLLLRQ